MKNLYKIEDELYIISDKEKSSYCIKECPMAGLNIDRCDCPILGGCSNKVGNIILTTNKSLIKDGVQAIDYEFLEWFVKNPSCEFVHFKQKQHFEADKSKRINPLNGVYYTYEIIVPSEEPTFVDKLKEYFENTSEEKIQKDWDETCEKTKGINSPTVEEFLEAQKQNLINMMQDDEKLGLYEEPKQETIEEAAKKYYEDNIDESNIPREHYELEIQNLMSGFAYKWQQEQNKNLYSEEEVLELLQKALTHQDDGETGSLITAQGKIRTANFYSWFEQFSKLKNG